MPSVDQWFSAKISDLMDILFLAPADDKEAIIRFRAGYEKALRVRKQAEDVMKAHAA
jgi:hypothetical protein